MHNYGTPGLTADVPSITLPAITNRTAVPNCGETSFPNTGAATLTATPPLL